MKFFVITAAGFLLSRKMLSIYPFNVLNIFMSRPIFISGCSHLSLCSRDLAIKISVVGETSTAQTNSLVGVKIAAMFYGYLPKRLK